MRFMHSDWLGIIVSCGVKGFCKCQPAAYALTTKGQPRHGYDVDDFLSFINLYIYKYDVLIMSLLNISPDNLHQTTQRKRKRAQTAKWSKHSPLATSRLRLLALEQWALVSDWDPISPLKKLSLCC
jgi:hypothetical protein